MKPITLKEIRKLIDSRFGGKEDAGPLAVLLRRESESEIQRTLDRMSSKFSAVLRLLLDGMNYLEIAGELGLPLRTVRSRINRGRNIWRKNETDNARKITQVDRRPLRREIVDRRA